MKDSMTINADSLLAQEHQLRRLAAGLLSSIDRRGDAVQESYLAVLEAKEPLARNISGYLARVLRNKVLRQGRRESQRHSVELQVRRSSAAEDTLSIVARLELRREIVDAVLELKDEQRQVIFLRFFEDMMPQQIATELKTPVSTVKTRLARGLQSLRERLERTHGGESALHSLLLSFTFAGKKSAGPALLPTMGLTAKLAAAVCMVALAIFAYRELSSDAPESNLMAGLDAESHSSADFDQGDAGRKPMRAQNQEPANAAAALIDLSKVQEKEVAHKEVVATPKGLLRVVNHEGKPVEGVAVVIEARQLDRIRRPFRAQSDAHGLVDPARALAALKAENAAELLCFRFGFPLLDAAVIPFDLKTQMETKDMELPATAPLHIRVLNEQGQPYKGALSLQVRGHPLGRDGKATGRFLTPYEATFVGSEHQVACVGLNLDLDIQVQDQEGRRPATSLSVRGPRSVDESPTLTLQLSAPYPQLRGRVLDRQGQPLASTRLEAALMLPRELSAGLKNRIGQRASTSGSMAATTSGLRMGRRSEALVIETDAKGVFSLPYRFAREALVGRELIVALGVNGQGLSAGPRLSLKLEDALTDENLDLGDLRLIAAPKLASGRVVDDRGQGIADVIVTALEALDEDAKAAKRPQFGRSKGKAISWARTDAKGHFEVLGDSSGRIRLRADLGGFESEESEVLNIGATAVELSCKRRASLSGRILVDDITKIWNVTISCRTAMPGVANFSPSSGPRATVANGGIDADGNFELHDLRAGIQTLEIQSAGQTLVSIKDINLKPGDELRPESLQQIQVEGLSSTPRVQLLDASGRPLAHRRAHILSVHEGRFSSQTSGSSVELDAEGSFWLIATRSYEKAAPIGVWGMRPAVLKIERPWTQVQLERGPTVDINFSLPSQLQEAELVAELRFSPKKGPSMMVPPPGAYQNCRLENGKAHFQVSHAGHYSLTLRRPGGSGAKTIKLSESSVEIPEDAKAVNLDITANKD